MNNLPCCLFSAAHCLENNTMQLIRAGSMAWSESIHEALREAAGRWQKGPKRDKSDEGQLMNKGKRQRRIQRGGSHNRWHSWRLTIAVDDEIEWTLGESKRGRKGAEQTWLSEVSNMAVKTPLHLPLCSKLSMTSPAEGLISTTLMRCAVFFGYVYGGGLPPRTPLIRPHRCLAPSLTTHTANAPLVCSLKVRCRLISVTRQ